MSEIQNPSQPSRRVKDRTGERVGQWTVIGFAGLAYDGVAAWLCRCDCGAEKTLRAPILQNQKSKSCGLKCPLRNLDLLNKLIGKQFGRLTVIEFHSRDQHHRAKYLCSCTCGAHPVVRRHSLLSGNAKSCGCLSREQKQLPAGQATWNWLFSSYKRGAARRGHAFELSFDEFKCIMEQACFYCGDSPRSQFDPQARSELARARSEVKASGIDRIVPSVGYTVANSRPCCKTCNYMKWHLGEIEFIRHADKISRHQNNKYGSKKVV